MSFIWISHRSYLLKNYYHRNYSTALTIFSKSANPRDLFMGGLSPRHGHDSCDFLLITQTGEFHTAENRHHGSPQNFALSGDH